MTVTCTPTYAPDDVALTDAGGETTESAYVVIEVFEPPGIPGPPPHMHPTHEEAFYVLDGEVTVQRGEECIRARPGTFTLVPRGVMHTFENSGARAARLLVIFPRPGLVSRFEELAALCAPPDHRRERDARTALAGALR